ncbi:MAG TPA: aspartyl/asparaginyl beta-hydroxylase domain-containing protein [Steroidobacteraceae bacterium]|jgi:aspartyl/asparaginyl beta-hydroxylase (cupin superfamily)|nr:aspartyl/asparaginyl beta-hydroxylase domain-containing protein [Steroidobacteraceae bacterium]
MLDYHLSADSNLPGMTILEESLRQRGADRLALSAGRRLLDHLMGTRDILQRWGQAPTLYRAGLFHSCYAREGDRRALFSLAERSTVRALIGQESEEVVYAFCTVDRSRLSEFRSGARDVRSGALLPQRVAIDLVLLEIAGTADDSGREDGAPGAGMARCSELGLTVRPHLAKAPPIFDDLTRALCAESEQLAIDQYLVGGIKLLGDPDSARVPLAAAARANPWVGETHLLLALAELLSDDWVSTRTEARKGLDLLRGWGTAWDKRRPWREWLRLGDWLCNAAGRGERDPHDYSRWLTKTWAASFGDPFALMQADTHQGPTPDTGNAAMGDGERCDDLEPLHGWRRFESFMGRFLTNQNDPRMTSYPALKAKPWHDPKSFPSVATLESSYPRIKREYRALSGTRGFQPEMEPIKRTGQWNIFTLYELGKKNLANCAKCPETTRIVESLAAVQTLVGLVYFSHMKPGTRILPHKGPTNLRIRCHLALEVPPRCGIRVGGERRTWTPGKCLVFDDSFEHETWNDGETTRVVLVLDFWHPDLTAVEVEALKGLHRHVHFQTEQLTDYWRRNALGRALTPEQEHWR